MSDLQTQSSLYSNLEELVEFRLLVKQKKLNHQQDQIVAQTGSHLAIKKGRGMTFSEVRQYQAGDDIRHIDWKVTARTQKPHTKLFVEENERPTLLVVEQTPNLFFGSKVRLKIAQAINIAAILAWVSLSQNERVGGISFSHQGQTWIPPKRNQQTVLNFLQQAIDQQQHIKKPSAPDSQAWPDALNQLLKVNKPGNKVFLIGDMMQLAKHAKAQLHKLKSRADVTAIHIYDELETQIPELGWLSMTSSFNNEQIVKLDSFRNQTRQTYAEIYQQQWQNTKEVFTAINLPIVAIATRDESLMSLIEKRLLQ